MNEPTTLKKALDTVTMAEMENAVDDAIAETAAQKVADFRPAYKATSRDKSNSMAEQMLGIAETVKAVHQEIDKLQEDVIMRLTVIRKTLGGKAT